MDYNKLRLLEDKFKEELILAKKNTEKAKKSETFKNFDVFIIPNINYIKFLDTSFEIYITQLFDTDNDNVFVFDEFVRFLEKETFNLQKLNEFFSSSRNRGDIEENKSDVIKPSEVDPTFLKSIEALYGKVNMEEDFFSSDLEKYYRVDEIDKETGSISHTLIKLASFDDLIKHLSQANESSQILQKSPSLNKDKELLTILEDINKVFNKFRTHLRKSYPDQYKNITKHNLDEESATGATGEGPLTPFAFKPIKKSLNEAPLNNFQNQRIKDFDLISKEMNDIYTMLSNAKNKTSAFYNSNPESNKIIYPTELVHDYFKDIFLILTQND